MSDLLTRLNTSLEGRYRVERELGEMAEVKPRWEALVEWERGLEARGSS